LSGSNDASIRLWNINNGETINTFFGHTNFIYRYICSFGLFLLYL
jgi:WD40 repeat protein